MQIGFFREQDVNLGGWLSLGGKYSTENPDHRNNFPITFNDRSGEIHLYQLSFYLQKPIGNQSDWNPRIGILSEE